MNANDLRPGMVIRHNGELFTIHRAEHRTPGNLRAFVQARMRNLRTGALSDHRFRSEDDVERAMIDETDMQYLYQDGDSYVFMNTENYEQLHLHREIIGDRARYLIPDVVLKVEFFEGRPVDIQLPQTVDLRVVETEPNFLRSWSRRFRAARRGQSGRCCGQHRASDAQWLAGGLS